MLQSNKTRLLIIALGYFLSLSLPPLLPKYLLSFSVQFISVDKLKLPNIDGWKKNSKSKTPKQ